MLKVLQRATHCYKTKRSKYSAKKHQRNVLGRLLNRDSYTLYVFFIFKRFGPQRRLHIGEMATKLKQIIDILMFSIVWNIYNTNRDNFMFLLLCCKKSVGKRTKVADHG